MTTSSPPHALSSPSDGDASPPREGPPAEISPDDLLQAFDARELSLPRPPPGYVRPLSRGSGTSAGMSQARLAKTVALRAPEPREPRAQPFAGWIVLAASTVVSALLLSTVIAKEMVSRERPPETFSLVEPSAPTTRSPDPSETSPTPAPSPNARPGSATGNLDPVATEDANVAVAAKVTSDPSPALAAPPMAPGNARATGSSRPPARTRPAATSHAKDLVDKLD